MHVEGKDIVDTEGKVMSLRGINVGSWFMMETWIASFGIEWEGHLNKLANETGIAEELSEALVKTGKFDDDTMTYEGYRENLRKHLDQIAGTEKSAPFWALLEKEPPILDAATLDHVLRSRFGDAGAEEIWDAFHQNWIKSDDLKVARDIGFNFIRLPFWYRWFEEDDHPGEYKEYGFFLLDKAIQYAKENELYVLLDFHGAPGGQNLWEHSGQMGRGILFKDEACQQRTFALWKAIAQRYKDEPAVLGYDCLNEPASAQDIDEWCRVHDGIYQAIRNVDTRHIIIMEDGYKSEELPYLFKGWFPVAADMGWTNVVYSFHFYQTGPLARHESNSRIIVRMAKRERERCGVPIYFGEYNSIFDDADSIKAMGLYGSVFNENGFHWSPWALKYTGAGSEKTLWGILQYAGVWEPMDVHRDTKEALLGKIARFDAANFKIHEAYAAELRRCCQQPVISVKEVK